MQILELQLKIQKMFLVFLDNYIVTGFFLIMTWMLVSVSQYINKQSQDLRSE